MIIHHKKPESSNLESSQKYKLARAKAIPVLISTKESGCPNARPKRNTVMAYSPEHSSGESVVTSTRINAMKIKIFIIISCSPVLLAPEYTLSVDRYIL